MNNEWDDLKSLWKKAKEEKGSSPKPNFNELIALGEAKKRKTVFSHYGNILIMGLTWSGVFYFFVYLFHFQMVISHIGIALMLGGLGLRIVIELFSTIRSQKIKISDTAAQSLERTLAFYRFRKSIHGPVTFVIVALYIIGFYLLTPEFIQHLPVKGVIAFDVAGLIAAVVLIRVIGKGMRQELRDLEKIVELQKSLGD